MQNHSSENTLSRQFQVCIKIRAFLISIEANTKDPFLSCFRH